MDLFAIVMYGIAAPVALAGAAMFFQAAAAHQNAGAMNALGRRPAAALTAALGALVVLAASVGTLGWPPLGGGLGALGINHRLSVAAGAMVLLGLLMGWCGVTRPRRDRRTALLAMLASLVVLWACLWLVVSALASWDSSSRWAWSGGLALCGVGAWVLVERAIEPRPGASTASDVHHHSAALRRRWGMIGVAAAVLISSPTMLLWGHLKLAPLCGALGIALMTMAVGEWLVAPIMRRRASAALGSGLLMVWCLWGTGYLFRESSPPWWSVLCLAASPLGIWAGDLPIIREWPEHGRGIVRVAASAGLAGIALGMAIATGHVSYY